MAALVVPGGRVDDEARARGVTIYMPDRRSPLRPAVLTEVDPDAGRVRFARAPG